MNFFFGKEVEGRFRNYPTLFVISDQEIDHILKYSNEYKVKQIYFGAGFQSKVNNLDILNKIKLKVKDEILVSYEFVFKSLSEYIQIKKLLPKCHLIICFKNIDLSNILSFIYLLCFKSSNKLLTVKLETKKNITCFNSYKKYVNSWNVYNDDIVLE